MKISQEAKFIRIKEILQYQDKFLAYQELPPFFYDRYGKNDIIYSSHQLAWDKPRYDWMCKSLPSTIKTAVEVGSSLGFFSLMLSYDRSIKITAFEPVADYAELSNILAELGGLTDKAFFHDTGVTLSDIPTLPSSDLFISLNVLHHAGNFYDTEEVEAYGSWLKYANAYLTEISQKFPFLIFQCGNSARGNAHFKGGRAIDVLVELLESSGYSVRAVGVIENPSKITYSTYSPEEVKLAPRISCARNLKTGLVDYFKNEEYIGSYKYGTLQRPIFFCEKHDSKIV